VIHSGIVFLTMLVLVNIGYYSRSIGLKAAAGGSLIILGLLSVAPGFLK